ncbi:MAG: hypothetical protein OD815_001282 [Candidatus Alkanophagales archaeon MCA70_species_2]|nr:hypothetical protein [Candidatus Alkanophaga liquidiphilum]
MGGLESFDLESFDRLILTCVFLRFSPRSISRLLNIDREVVLAEIEKLMLGGYIAKEGLLPIHVPILDRFYMFNRLMLTSKGYALIDKDMVEQVSAELEARRGLVTRVMASLLDVVDYGVRWLLVFVVALVMKVVGVISKVILTMWNIPRSIKKFIRKVTRKIRRKKRDKRKTGATHETLKKRL